MKLSWHTIRNIIHFLFWMKHYFSSPCWLYYYIQVIYSVLVNTYGYPLHFSFKIPSSSIEDLDIFPVYLVSRQTYRNLLQQNILLRPTWKRSLCLQCRSFISASYIISTTYTSAWMNKQTKTVHHFAKYKFQLYKQ